MLAENIEQYKKKNLRPKSLLVCIQTSKLLYPINKTPLKKLNVAQTDNLLNNLNKSSSTKKKVYQLLKSSLAKAKILGLEDYNVMDNIEPPTHEQEEVEIYTESELKRIRNFLLKDKYYSKYFPLFILALQTGARLGELLGLKISSVHPAYIDIKNNLQLIESKLVDAKPKTDNSYRKIPINNETYLIIKDYIGSRKDGYVFSTENNTPYSPTNINRTWCHILNGAEVTHNRYA